MSIPLTVCCVEPNIDKCDAGDGGGRRGGVYKEEEEDEKEEEGEEVVFTRENRGISTTQRHTRHAQHRLTPLILIDTKHCSGWWSSSL
jgi:hypothetical protein